MHDVSKIVHEFFFDKMKDPGSEFDKCVNSFIFSARLASVFLQVSTYFESFFFTHLFLERSASVNN